MRSVEHCGARGRRAAPCRPRRDPRVPFGDDRSWTETSADGSSQHLTLLRDRLSGQNGVDSSELYRARLMMEDVKGERVEALMITAGRANEPSPPKKGELRVNPLPSGEKRPALD